jgi:hypothetical protein
MKAPQTFVLALGLAAASQLALAAEGEGSAFPPVAETSGGGFAPASAAAFGATGQLALSLGANEGGHFFLHGSGGRWQLQLAPSADYFIMAHVSVGGLVGYTHASGGAGTGTNSAGSDAFRIGARAGYALAFNDRFGLWPRAGLAFDVSSANHNTSTSTAILVFVPVLFHPATHFFVGLGPSADIGLSGGGGNTFGVDSVLGGWF